VTDNTKWRFCFVGDSDSEAAGGSASARDRSKAKKERSEKERPRQCHRWNSKFRPRLCSGRPPMGTTSMFDFRRQGCSSPATVRTICLDRGVGRLSCKAVSVRNAANGFAFVLHPCRFLGRHRLVGETVVPWPQCVALGASGPVKSCDHQMACTTVPRVQLICGRIERTRCRFLDARWCGFQVTPLMPDRSLPVRPELILSSIPAENT